MANPRCYSVIVFVFCCCLATHTWGQVSATKSTPVITRTITPLSDHHYDVVITITATGISGFAKYTETLPDSAQVKVTEPQNASTNKVGNQLKFIWTSFPQESIISLHYVLTLSGRFDARYKGVLRFVSDTRVTEVGLKEEGVSIGK